MALCVPRLNSALDRCNQSKARNRKSMTLLQLTTVLHIFSKNARKNGYFEWFQTWMAVYRGLNLYGDLRNWFRSISA